MSSIKESLTNESVQKLNISDVQKSLSNINIGLSKANKAGVFEIQESHQLYNDIQLVSTTLKEKI